MIGFANIWQFPLASFPIPIIGLEGAVASLSPLYGQPLATWTSDPSVDRKRSRKQPSFHITVTEVPELSWYSITLYKNRSIALFANLNCFVSFILYILVCLLNCSLLRYSFYQWCFVPVIVLYAVKIITATSS